MIGKAIYYLLSNDATVSGLVGTKIYPERTPEAINSPFVIYSENTLEPSDTKDGVSTLDILNYDIVSYADTESLCSDVDSSIRNVLDRYSGTANTITIDSIRYLSQRSDYDNQAKVHIKISTYQIRHKR